MSITICNSDTQYSQFLNSIDLIPEWTKNATVDCFSTHPFWLFPGKEVEAATFDLEAQFQCLKTATATKLPHRSPYLMVTLSTQFCSQFFASAAVDTFWITCATLPVNSYRSEFFLQSLELAILLNSTFCQKKKRSCNTWLFVPLLSFVRSSRDICVLENSRRTIYFSNVEVFSNGDEFIKTWTTLGIPTH